MQAKLIMIKLFQYEPKLTSLCPGLLLLLKNYHPYWHMLLQIHSFANYSYTIALHLSSISRRIEFPIKKAAHSSLNIFFEILKLFLTRLYIYHWSPTKKLKLEAELRYSILLLLYHKNVRMSLYKITQKNWN